MNKKTLLLLIPFAAAALAGCSPTNPKPQCETADVTISKSSAQVKVGESIKLTAESSIEGCTIVWSSSNEAIATVDQEGNVTGVAVGECKIIAGNAECSLTVYSEDKPTPTHAGTLEDPFDGADAVLMANSLEPGDATESQYYIKGTVASFEETFDPTYGNYSFKIDGGFICWRLKNGPQFEKFEDGDIEVGDKVTVYAYIQKFHKDGQEDKPETKEGYVHSVEKEGPVVPSLKLDKTEASLKIGKTMTITATVKNTEEAIAWSIEGTAASMVVSGDNKSVTLTGESVGPVTVKAKLANAGLEESCVVSVSEPAPVGQGAVYTFVNDKTSSQNWSTILEDGFKKATVCEGEEIITGYKDGENAYIGGNGGSGDTAWNIWNCLKVGKNGSQGKITIKLDSDLGFESIKISAIGARDDGTLIVNGISKDVTKKATKDDLEPMVLEYDIGGGISELTLTSKPNPGSKENFGICITRIEFVGRQEAVLESITADMTNKTYEVGDELSLDGLTVTGHYSDGNDAPITEGITTSLEAGHIMTLEDTSLRVSVGKIYTYIELTVTDPTLVLDCITIAGVKTQYYAGQTLGDVTVTAHYIGGKELDVTSSAVLKIGGNVVSSDHVMALGESKIVATYEDETDEVEFTVIEDTVTSLAVTELHRQFNTGDTFVRETVTATYASGKSKDVTSEAAFTGYDMDTAGEQTVKVEFGGAKTTYSITVSEFVIFEKATDIAVGDIVALVNEDAKKEMTSVSDIGVVSDYTDYIAHSFELEVVAGSQANTFAFKNGDKYLNFTGSSNKLYLTAEAVTDESSWTVEFSDGNVTIKNVAASTRFIQYNSSQPRFACYTNAQKSVQLYKAPADPAVLQELEVATADHRAFYLNDKFVPETIMAKYDKGENKDVTALCEFSKYNMSISGQQSVDVSYTENGVTKTASYEITVSAIPTPKIESISIDADDMLTEYYDGDDIVLTGVKVFANYESGSPVELDASKYSLTCSPEKADIESKKTTLTATLLDTEAGVEPATLDVNLTVTAKPVPVEDVVDEIDINDLLPSETTGYTAFTNKTSTAGIKYSGKANRSTTTGHTGALQLNTTSNDSCVYTSLSNRLVKKVSITFNGTNTNKVSVYAKNASFTSCDTTDAVLLKEFSESGSVDVLDSYRNILIVSNGAVYLDSFEVNWGANVLPNAAESISISETSKTIGVGDTTAFDLVATLDGVGDPGSVSWKSDNAAATVDNNGHVVGVSKGTATITATSLLNEELTASCVVTVTAGKTETTVYSFNTSDYKGSNNSYDGNCDIKCGDVTWNFNGNSTMAPWRIGGKSITNKNRVMYSKNAISNTLDIDTAIISIGNTGGSITFNSITLEIHSTADGAEKGSSTDLVETLSQSSPKANTSYTFKAGENVSWKGMYVRVMFNVTVSGSSNKYYEVAGITFKGMN